MRPSHRLDLLLVPYDPGAPVRSADAVLEDLVTASVILASGEAGTRARTWCPGGFARVTVERPRGASDGLAFFAGGQGGFRVRCPRTGALVIAGFGAAIAAWRAGGPRALVCPSCGATHPLEALDYAPAAAFGPWALVTADAGSATLTDEALVLATRRIGQVAVVLRRG